MPRYSPDAQVRSTDSGGANGLFLPVLLSPVPLLVCLLASFQFDPVPQDREVGGYPLRGLGPTAVPRVVRVDVRAGLVVDVVEEGLTAEGERVELQRILHVAGFVVVLVHVVIVVHGTAGGTPRAAALIRARTGRVSR